MSSEIAEFRQLLARRLGWMFDDKDLAQLDDVLDERAAAAELSRTDYLARLGSHWDSEVTELAERLSITETYFFRHGEQFRALRETVLPERIAARDGNRVLRLLSVACSSGEEAYSLAIAAREAQPAGDWVVSVTGVDANPAMLRKAGRARYTGWSLRETPPGVRERWFRPVDDEFQVADEIRALVLFARTNVADDDPDLWATGQYDVIFCRNLLMYLTRPVAASLIGRMTAALAPGGYLFLGHTDSLGNRPDGLERLHDHRAFYYRRLTTADTPVPRPAPPPERHRRPARPLTDEDAYNRAIGLLQADRFGDALELITTRLPGRSQPRDTLLHGVLLVQTGRLDEAAVVARRLADADGLNADAHLLLGLCLEGGQSVDEAIAQYRVAAFLDPAFALARLRLGQLARRRGEDRPAAADLERALGLLPRERSERIILFGGGFGRMALTMLCRSELDACGAHR
jgi:chemotaxis protein methyltransferase CheR